MHTRRHLGPHVQAPEEHHLGGEETEEATRVSSRAFPTLHLRFSDEEKLFLGAYDKKSNCGIIPV